MLIHLKLEAEEWAHRKADYADLGCKGSAAGPILGFIGPQWQPPPSAMAITCHQAITGTKLTKPYQALRMPPSSHVGDLLDLGLARRTVN